MSKDNDKNGIKEIVTWIIGILASIAVIVYTFWVIYRTHEPHLKAIVDCENWKAPYYVEEELRGMDKVNNLCKSLNGVMDPNLNVAFPDVNDLSRKIIGEIEVIEPCEADNVDCLESMHTIRVQNDGDYGSENVGIIFEDAKYIEYLKRG